jgi:23S rRNA (adenine-N6)-dimethyltransferase
MSAHSPRVGAARALSQHSLRAAAAERIIASTGLAPPMRVFELGAGDGALTAALVRRCLRVTAVEIERAAWSRLRERFRGEPLVSAVLADLLAVELPRQGPYAVVSNVPFAVTAPLLRRLLATPNPPRLAALVVQREAAQKWAGLGYETLASVLLKNQFVVDVPVAIHRTDFDPRPNVDCVLLRLRRRARPCVEPRGFEALVRRGFGNGRGTVARNLGGRAGAQRLAAAGISRDALPHELSFEQWLALM